MRRSTSRAAAFALAAVWFTGVAPQHDARADARGYVGERCFNERAYLKSYGAIPLVPDFVKLDWTKSPNPEK